MCIGESTAVVVSQPGCFEVKLDADESHAIYDDVADCGAILLKHYLAGAVGQDDILWPVGNGPFCVGRRRAAVGNRRASLPSYPTCNALMCRSTLDPMNCPTCGIVKPARAPRCDCGHDFKAMVVVGDAGLADRDLASWQKLAALLGHFLLPPGSHPSQPRYCSRAPTRLAISPPRMLAVTLSQT